MSNLPLTEMKSDVRLDSEEAHYTRLVEQYRELEAENENLKRLVRNWLVWHEEVGAPKPGRLREESELAL